MGTWIVAGSVSVAVAVAFLFRTRLPAPMGALILALAGAGTAWGGMLLQPDPSAGEVVLAVALMAVLVPAHVRIVLGKFGRAGRGRGIRAMADPAGPPR